MEPTVVDWVDNLIQLTQTKFGAGAAAVLAGLLGFQKLRKSVQTDRKGALHEEAQIDVLQILRGELSRLRDNYKTLETQFNTLHEENIGLKSRIRDLEDHVCFKPRFPNDNEQN